MTFVVSRARERKKRWEVIHVSDIYTPLIVLMRNAPTKYPS